MNRIFRDRAEAAFGIALIIAVPGFFIAAFSTGEWRYLIGTAICAAMLAMKQ